LLTGEQSGEPASQVGHLMGWMVWALVLAGAGGFSRRVLPLLRASAMVVIIVQLAAVSWSVLTAEPPPPGVQAAREESLQRLAALSSTRNVIVLFLDGMHRDYVVRVLSESSELQAAFAGFRVFTDHLATFPTTRFSVPAMLTGRNYDNTVPANEFLGSTLATRDSLPGRLQDLGWDVGLASTIRATLAAPADTRVAVEGFVRGRMAAEVLGLELLDLSLLRHSPSGLGNWIYNEGSWRLRGLSDASRDNYHVMRSLWFIEEYVSRLTVSSPDPVFRFVHVGGAHPPLVADAQCEFIGVRSLMPEAYAEQVECALRQALLLVDRLAELGVLDRSFVVVASDHGIHLKNRKAAQEDAMGPPIDRAAAALMIKPFGPRGSLEFDSSPTSITDLPAILTSAARHDELGNTFVASVVPPGRRRDFFFHRWQRGDWRKPYLTALHHFEVSAGAADLDAWTWVETTASPELDTVERKRELRSAEDRFGPRLEVPRDP
jgi:hypothetical protein